jgi:hypothetical protein
MIPAVRYGILNVLTNRSNLSEESIKDNLLVQLQKMFSFLLLSIHRSYSPEDWAYSYKDETGLAPINVMQQHDVNEFLQVLCDRLEGHLPHTSLPNNHMEDTNTYKTILPSNLLQQSFGGRLCNQMIREGNANENGILEEDNIREQEEQFVCISLEVKGFVGLEDSLSKFVTGEQISNFQWNDTLPRLNIIKRQCLLDTSDVIIFHLKRFELNFDTFRREKVNDEFKFPNIVNLYPYTKEGLDATTKSDMNNDVNMDKYKYELSGVVVHTGSADSGHYYAYIKEFSSDVIGNDNSNTCQWIEFNDSEVRPFAEAKIPD